MNYYEFLVFVQEEYNKALELDIHDESQLSHFGHRWNALVVVKRTAESIAKDYFDAEGYPKDKYTHEYAYEYAHVDVQKPVPHVTNT